MFVMLIVCIFLGLMCPGGAWAQVEPGETLKLAVAHWAYEVRDEGDYDVNLDGEFPKGERAYAYLELVGFEVGEEDEFFFLDLSVDVALKTKNGFRLFSQTGVLEFEPWYLSPPDSFWFYIWVDIPRWAPRGTYGTEITIHDQVSGTSLVEEKVIRVF